eukprot:7297271-Alexandrium_andersonii.AAC.1
MAGRACRSVQPNGFRSEPRRLRQGEPRLAPGDVPGPAGRRRLPACGVGLGEPPPGRASLAP